jgi:hypothetical protein
MTPQKSAILARPPKAEVVSSNLAGCANNSLKLLEYICHHRGRFEVVATGVTPG